MLKKTYYDTIAQKENKLRVFIKNTGRAQKSRRKAFKIIRQINPQNILDVGCGLATDYKLIKKYNLDIDYTGIDKCNGFIKINKKIFPEAKLGIANVEALPFKDKLFDIVICRAVLEHIFEIKEALSELMRVSKDRVLITWKKPPSQHEKIRFSKKKNYYSNTYSVDMINKAISDSNFTIIKKIRIGPHQIWHIQRNLNDILENGK